jgi:hypothetical protein
MSLYAAQVTGEALAAAAVETVLALAAGTTKRLKIRRWGVSFNGTNVANTPVQVQLIRITSAGSSTSGTPKKLDEADVAPLAAFLSAFTAEPSTGDVLEAHYVSPAGGQIIETYFDDAPIVGVSGRLAIRILGNDAVNASAFIHFEE